MNQVNDVPSNPTKWVRGLKADKAKVVFQGTMHTVHRMAYLSNDEFNKNIPAITKSINTVYTLLQSKKGELHTEDVAALTIIQKKLKTNIANDTLEVKQAIKEVQLLCKTLNLPAAENVLTKEHPHVHTFSSAQLKEMSPSDFWEHTTKVLDDPKIQTIQIEGQGTFDVAILATLIKIQAFVAPNTLGQFVNTLLEIDFPLRNYKEGDYPPLHLHAITGKKELIAEDLQNTPVDTPNKTNVTALQLASSMGNIEIAAMLIKARANVHLTHNATIPPPLAQASHGGSIKMVQLLLDNGAIPGRSELIGAARSGHTEIIKLYLERGVNPNAQNAEGLTPLLAAAMNGHTDAVRLLIKSNADLNLQEEHGFTPLMLAAFNGNLEAFQLLLKAGADPNIVDPDGGTLLSLLKTSRPEHWKLMRQLVLVTTVVNTKSFDKQVLHAKLLSHAFERKGNIVIEGKKVRFEGGQREIVAAQMAKSCARFPEMASIANSLQLAADQQEHTPQQTLDRINQGEPTCILTGFRGHAVTVLIQGDLFMLCDRGKVISTPLFVRRFDRSKLDLNTLVMLQDLKHESPEKYIQTIFTTLREKLGFIQTKNEETLADLANIPFQKMGNCSWAASEGIVKALLLLEELKKRSDKIPTDAVEKANIKQAVETAFTKWQLSTQISLLEKSIKDPAISDLLLESFSVIWRTKTLFPETFPEAFTPDVSNLERQFIKERPGFDSFRFRIRKIFCTSIPLIKTHNTLQSLQEKFTHLSLRFLSKLRSKTTS